MTDGFRVDLGALRRAATGIRDTLDEMATKKVSDIDPPAASMGHDALAGTTEDFCSRWELGVENLTKDIGVLVDGLDRCITAYDNTDEGVAAGYNGYVVREHGTDPGAG